jgi:hypothetical protein
VALFSPDPLADISRTVAELDTLLHAATKKVNNLQVDVCYFLEIQRRFYRDPVEMPLQFEKAVESHAAA